VLDTPDFGYIALIAVGIQQVSSVQWTSNLKSKIINLESEIRLSQGDELGYFLFGGSDIIILFEPGKAPDFEPEKVLKVGEKIQA